MMLFTNVSSSWIGRRDVSGEYTIRSFFGSLVSLQVRFLLLFGLSLTFRFAKTGCCAAGSAEEFESKLHIFVWPFCLSVFLPQHALSYIRTPYFILNSAYDVYQASFRNEMLKALESFEGSQNGGMFLNSCFTHCQSEVQEAWFGDSPRLHNKTIAEAVGDWYFDRGTAKEVDCPYPCDSTCDNLIPSNQTLHG
ncbi:Pectinacetylesterase [Musa troglodytarum]|uniref:Pectin acetylesterase n=1 Tax=Musa troglodytarum TaxID=320322 RepID=A0A9E7JE70_9LILI|nr:Pectinacetylesterase [Musa troglodytarum]